MSYDDGFDDAPPRQPSGMAQRLTPNQQAALDRGRGGGGRGSRGGGGQRRFGRESGDDRGKYIEVRQRVMDFYTRFPDGRLESEIVQGGDTGFGSRIEAITEIVRPTFSYEGGTRVPKGEKKVTRLVGLVVVQGRAYRTADDPRPGIGHSMLMMPGETPYTEGSELENAETSAIGRAIAATGIGITDSYASAQELRNKHSDDDEEIEREEAAARAFREATGQTGTPAEPTGVSEPAPAPSAAPVSPEAAPEASPAAVIEAELRAEGELVTEDGELLGLSGADFIQRARDSFIPSATISAKARALFPRASSVKDLTDAERLELWSELESALSTSSSSSATGGV